MPRFLPAGGSIADAIAARVKMLDYLNRMGISPAEEALGRFPKPETQGLLPGMVPSNLRNIADVYNPGTLAVGNKGIQTAPLLGAEAPPERMPTPPAPPPMLTPRTDLGGLQGEMFNPKEVVQAPGMDLRGLPAEKIFKGKGKAEAPSKAQLKALVERLLGREVPPNERLVGPERTSAMNEIMTQGVPERYEPYGNLVDMGSSPVTGLPVTETPGGRALRLPIEEARLLALQHPERFKPGGFRNYAVPGTKEVYEVPPGSPEDIIGGIGLRGKKFENVLTKNMIEADKMLGKAETEASGYSMPKPADMRIATAQGFKVFNQLLTKGSLKSDWQEIFEKAQDTKAHLTKDLNAKEYFVETFQKYAMARPKFVGRYKEEFKFIDGLGEQLRKVIAPEAQLAEKVKTPVGIPQEGEKVSFAPTPTEVSKPNSITREAARSELEKSYQSSKTFKKFFDEYLKKHKKGFTPAEVKAAWQEYMNTGKVAEPVQEESPLNIFNPLIAGGK